MEKYGQLFESIFKRKLTDNGTEGYLESLTKEHPYFSVAQFYLLSLSQKGVNGYKEQAKKTSVLFNNNHWLNFQLLEAGDNNLSPALDTLFNEEPIETNSYDKVFTEEQHFIETIIGTHDIPVEEKQEETVIEQQSSSEPAEEKNEIINEETEQPAGEINIPIEEENDIIIEEAKQPIKQIITESTEEINIPAAEETEQPSEETLPVPAEKITTMSATEEIVTNIEETFVEIEKQEEEINIPVIKEEPPVEDTVPAIVEEVNTDAMEETVALPFEEQDQQIETHKEEAIIPPVEENKPEEEIIIEPVAESKTESANEPLLFEPLHTTDYFASVGIKLSEEEKTSGTLGKQLMSFTQWLKTMKKVHAAELAQTTHPKEVEAASAENSIQKLAEKSNQENDVITEAMADVLMQQGRKDKALEILEKLSLLNPGKSTYFAAKINQIKEK